MSISNRSEALNPLTALDRSVIGERGNLAPDLQPMALLPQFDQVRRSLPQLDNLGFPNLDLTGTIQTAQIAGDDPVRMAQSKPDDVRPAEERRRLAPSQGRPYPSLAGVQPEYREDGSLASTTEQRPDGSTRFARFYQPNNREQVDEQRENGFDVNYLPDGSLEEETIVRPDGSSTYTHYGTDGRPDLIQITNSSGDIETYSRNRFGSLDGTIQYANGGTASGTFYDDLSPSEAFYAYADGSTRSVFSDPKSDDHIDLTQLADGTTRTVTTNRRTGVEVEIIEFPDGTSMTMTRDPRNERR